MKNAKKREISMRRKQFLYCESTDGGMHNFLFDSEDDLAESLRSWMEKSCRASDGRLVSWMNNAAVGEYTEHRLGVAVRLRDVEKRYLA